MSIRLRTIFFLILGVFVIWLLYLAHNILAPFILGAVFAYIFNPAVNLFTRKIKLPRTISIIIVYLILITVIVEVGIFFNHRVFVESRDIHTYLESLLKTTRHQISSLPGWLRPTLDDLLKNFDTYQHEGTFSFAAYFPRAVSEFAAFIIFIFSGFYFLKEGAHFITWFMHYVPKRYKMDVEILIRNINHVLGGYLRGQVFLIFLMSFLLFIVLTILGIRFSLLIAIFSGLAEIVPVIGPIVATSVAVAVAMITGTNNFGLPALNIGLIVILIYFLLRQIEDYFVIPVIMGRITKLHPFVIFFAVVAGGDIAGTMGLILAVPTAAVIRILIEFFYDQFNGEKLNLQENSK